MKNIFCTLALLFVMSLAGCSSTIGTHVAHPPKPYNEVYYRFEKGLFLPNKYYLTVINHSERTVAFFTQGDSNYLTFPNGSTAPVSTSHGSLDYLDKGMFWISPGESLSIAFNIPKNEINGAVTITFKGTSGIKAQVDNTWNIEDERELIVTYDVRTTEFSVKENKDNPFAPLSPS